MSVPLVGEPTADGGRDYFVDPENGDDEHGDGTRLRPVRTFRKLAESLQEQPIERNLTVTLVSSQPDDSDPLNVKLLGNLGVHIVKGDAPRPRTYEEAERDFGFEGERGEYNLRIWLQGLFRSLP